MHLLRRLWLDGRLFAANTLVANLPSHTLRLWFYRAVMGYRIGQGSSIFMKTTFETPGRLTIGDWTTINRSCRLDSRGTLRIGNSVSISNDVVILTAEHAVQSADFVGTEEPVVIEDYVFLGTRAMVLPGVHIGRGAVVAAGAVVTRAVAPYTIVGGVPARPLGTRTQQLDYRVFYRRLFQ